MSEIQLIDINSPNTDYGRSHIFTSHYGINPLVTAAHPILSIIDRLQLSRKVETNGEFFSHLNYEFKVFEGRSAEANYEDETIFIAHYLLSACINEILDEKNFNAFKKLMPGTDPTENTPDIKFFEILEKIIDKPDHYLDLLELIYLCLSLGFEGKYQKKAHEELQKLTGKLFKIISSRRQNPGKPLFASADKFQKINPKPWHWSMLGIGSLLLISLLYFGSNFYLDNKAFKLVSLDNSLISEQ